MTSAARLWASAAALSGLAAVALGAAGAHVLDVTDTQRFDLAWQYHALHVVVMLVVALALRPGVWTHLTLVAWMLGSLLFCGTLYRASIVADAGTGLAPVGGMLLMLGWLLLTVAVFRSAPRRSHPGSAPNS